MTSSVLMTSLIIRQWNKKQLNTNKCLVLQLGLLSPAGAPRAERRPGASWNMTEFRFYELQNRRKQCRSFVQIMMRSQKKKFFTGILTFFSVKIRWSPKRRSYMLIPKCHLMGPFRAFLKPRGSLMGPPKSMGPGVIIPPAPPLGGPALQYTLVCTVHLLSQYKSSLCYYRQWQV